MGKKREGKRNTKKLNLFGFACGEALLLVMIQLFYVHLEKVLRVFAQRNDTK